MEKKGFTLIELLVVIAIIGILSSIVLVSVNSARNKAKDASVKGNLAQINVAAELFYDGPGAQTYTAVCTAATSDVPGILTAIDLQNSGTPTCISDATTYCASTALVGSTDLACIDYKGKKGILACTAATPYNCP